MQKNYKKELQLKGNSVKRLMKEYNMYQNEVEKMEIKAEELKTNNAEDYDKNKHNDFVLESIGARDSIKTKLRTFTDDLIALINVIEDEETKNLEEYKSANDILAAVQELFQNI